MTSTLTSSPAADVLARLQGEARGQFEQRRAESSGQRTTPRHAGPDEWRTFFERDAKELYLAVRPDTANLLYILARTRQARSVVEFGTSFGVSTLCLAAALRDNGGGRVIGTEFVASKAESAAASLTEAGLGDLVEIRLGDALETLSRDLPDSVDLLFLDGAKHMYFDVVKLLEPRLATGALVVVDNSDASPELLEHLRVGGDYVSSAVQSGVEVALRVN